MEERDELSVQELAEEDLLRADFYGSLRIFSRHRRSKQRSLACASFRPIPLLWASLWAR